MTFGKLMRQRKNNLTRHAGVLALLRAFRSVPEREPVGVGLWCVLGQKDEGIQDAFAVPVIVRLSGALIFQN